ncbi:hypothetical protein LY76DRAFT_372055 [Colletotrichum caudatum]|nr:hypothetical protein LY76DRAFT_372055 [Colletotrichum caudatum]
MYITSRSMSGQFRPPWTQLLNVSALFALDIRDHRKRKRGACLRPIHVHYASKDICARALRAAVRRDAPIELRVATIGRVILLGISTVLAAINTLLLFDLPSAYAQECRSSFSCF